MTHIRKCICLIVCAVALFSCAPVPVVEEVSETSSDSMQTHEDTDQPSLETEADNAVFDVGPHQGGFPDPGMSMNENTSGIAEEQRTGPDWKQRYQELYHMYRRQFRRPSVGVEVTLKLASGGQLTGVVSEITDDQVFLEVEDGMVGFSPQSLKSEAAQVFFASSFAHERAMRQGRKEYQEWKQSQGALPAGGIPPTPTPRQFSQSSQTQSPFSPPSRRSSPKNEGPNGHVRQVEEYIRNNAAKPDSLRVKAWGPVQPHENGYKVRVQYNLQSTAGLGVSEEDMMFFMTRSGRVYRRAAVK